MNIFKKSIPFKTTTDIPPLTNKVILITGANAGLGKQCVLDYARHNPAEIWLCARTQAKARAALEDMKPHLPTPGPVIKLLELDLSSLESVKKSAERFKREAQRLDILMLNAGIMATPPGLSEDGFEMQFCTNYLGHALLTKLLLPVLQHTSTLSGADVRVVAVSSHGHFLAPRNGIVFDTLKTDANELGPYTRYGQSKIAQLMWVRWMTKLYPDITSVSVHPGVVSTGLMRGATGSACWVQVLGRVAEKVVPGVENGVRNQLWASVGEVRSGVYYEPVGIEGCEDERANDEGVAEMLWGWTEEELRGYVVW